MWGSASAIRLQCPNHARQKSLAEFGGSANLGDRREGRDALKTAGPNCSGIQWIAAREFVRWIS